MKNRDLYLKDPLTFELANNGVSKVAEIGKDHEQLKTLRFELETFVCDGEYAKGLDRILTAYLGGLNRAEQQAAWVSGFFGSGKSHLVKMLRYLWVDFKFPDGASARSIAHLPTAIQDLLTELSNRGRRYGGLKAAAGTLGAGNMDNVRLAFLQLIFRAVDLPENLAGAKFVLWLREKNLFEKVTTWLKSKSHNPDEEIRNFYVSTPLAEALVAADPTYGTPQNAQGAVRAQFPTTSSPTMDECLHIIRQIFSEGDQLPCTLIVVDEIQQFIGEKLQRAMDVQEIAEHFCRDLNSRMLLVGTGQSALTGTTSLSRLQARFTIKVPLSDTDVENVIRQTVLAKKPEKIPEIKKVIETNQGEISRHLHNTRLAATPSDQMHYAADYPLLPVRRRFWEKVLRNVDTSGTTAQLRTQLKIVFDSARATGDLPLGHVVAADFIYDQIATDLLNTGVLQREYHEIILGQRNGTHAGTLKSRLCATIFLVSRLPRATGADDGVRATPEILADLLVENLEGGGAKLRQEIPKLLEELVAQGRIMPVENEYCLQTREGASWTHDFNSRRTRILNDESKLTEARDQALSAALQQVLRPVSLQHGASKQPRSLEVILSNTRPAQRNQEIVLWVRHGWAEAEGTIETDARAAGSNSPMLFGFLPRLFHDEFKQGLAGMLAAQEAIESHGPPTGLEATQARNAIQTQLDVARQRVQNCLRQILAGARVFLGGGSEGAGLELADKVSDAATSALQRLFPQFADADHANWPQVLNGAKAGNVGALASVGYQGETVRHPVCQQVYGLIGPGKKGKEVREQFKNSPFGWPQDAIDAALVMLTLSGNLRAAINGTSTPATTLTQTQISGASFYVDIPPLTVMQRLDLKALFQKLSISTANGQESVAATAFLSKLIELIEVAGGEPPLPEKAAVQPIRELQSLSGNAQLLAIHGQKDALTTNIAAWTKVREGIAQRFPRWRRLEELHVPAGRLAEAAEVASSIGAIASSRGLLAEPDAVPPLIQKLLGGLRAALNSSQADLEATYKREMSRLDGNPIWLKLEDEQRQCLVQQLGLQPPVGIRLANEEEILAALQTGSLDNRRTLVEALPQRFSRALEEAMRLLEPRATRISLPSATIRTEAELDAWLAEARKQVQAKLSDGPVII